MHNKFGKPERRATNQTHSDVVDLRQGQALSRRAYLWIRSSGKAPVLAQIRPSRRACLRRAPAFDTPLPDAGHRAAVVSPPDRRSADKQNASDLSPDAPEHRTGKWDSVFGQNRCLDKETQQHRFSASRSAVLAFCGAVALIVASLGTPAMAATCGNTASGFSTWITQFRKEAGRAGISQRTLDRAFANVRYATKTISLDRNQRSFKLSFDEFMRKRGANTIISQGKKKKRGDARLFNALEKKYGIPAGPLIAIWGMESGFGRFTGNQHTMSAVATLAYDCRRSEFFTEQLYAQLQLIQKGWLNPNFKGAAHGEIGQTQFLPANVVRFGVDGDRNGSVNLGSKADALASTANFLRGHGWKRGVGYQPGQANFQVITKWNAAGVYQKAIAKIGAEIDG